MYSKKIQELIKLFSKFPTVGPRTATRFVFHILQEPKEEIEKLTKAILEVKEKTKFCSLCFKSFEGEGNLCEICSDPKRDKSKLCVVEKEIDLDSIENTKTYNGLYFILGGVISKLKEEEIKKLRIEELKKRLKEDKQIKEVILALNPTSEGQATTLYLKRVLKGFNVKVTTLAKGLPVGGELEYADPETLSSAFENRKTD